MAADVCDVHSPPIQGESGESRVDGLVICFFFSAWPRLVGLPPDVHAMDLIALLLFFLAWNPPYLPYFRNCCALLRIAALALGLVFPPFFWPTISRDEVRDTSVCHFNRRDNFRGTKRTLGDCLEATGCGIFCFCPLHISWLMMGSGVEFPHACSFSSSGVFQIIARLVCGYYSCR